MNWDKLNLVNFNNPILLDENIDRKEFNEIIKIATEKKTKYFDVNNKIWMCRSPFRNLISLFSKTETAVSKPKLIYELSKKGIKIFLSKYIEKKYKLS